MKERIVLRDGEVGGSSPSSRTYELAGSQPVCGTHCGVLGSLAGDNQLE